MHYTVNNLSEMKIKFLLIITILSVSVSFSQKKWTLKECVNHALENNISVKQNILILELAELNVKNAKGNFEFIYNTKKYGIPCERRFEINPEKIVIGFVSNGCF